MSNKFLIVNKNNSKSSVDVKTVRKIVLEEVQDLTLNGVQGIQGIQGNPGIDGLNGLDGNDGLDGESAYQVAVNNGFVGTETEWLESLITETYIVHVKDFGAVGDGVTDDSTAIQNAIDYVASFPNGGEVNCTNHVYGVGSTINVNSPNIRIRGGKFIAVGTGWVNSTITYNNRNLNGDMMFKITGMWATLQDMVLDCGRSTLNTVVSIAADNYEGHGAGGILVIADQCTIKDVSISYFKGYGIKTVNKTTELYLNNIHSKEWVWNNDVGTVAYLGALDPVNYRRYASFAIGTGDVIGIGLIGAFSKYPFLGWGGQSGDTAYNTQWTSCHFYNGSHVTPTNMHTIFIEHNFYNSSWNNTYIDNGFVEIRQPRTSFVQNKLAFTSNSTVTRTFKVYPSITNDTLLGLLITNSSNAKTLLEFKSDDTGSGYTYDYKFSGIIENNLPTTVGDEVPSSSVVMNINTGTDWSASGWTNNGNNIWYQIFDFSTKVAKPDAFSVITVTAEDIQNNIPNHYPVGVRRQGYDTNIFKISIDRRSSGVNTLKLKLCVRLDQKYMTS